MIKIMKNHVYIHNDNVKNKTKTKKLTKINVYIFYFFKIIIIQYMALEFFRIYKHVKLSLLFTKVTV